MTGDIRWLTAAGLRAGFEPATGHLPHFEIGGRRPLHVAPWRAPDAIPPPGTSRTEMLLAGDFFCCPFATDDVGDDPLHGWPSCSGWIEAAGDAATATFRLDRAVRGARVEKTLAVRDDHPVLYQRHRLTGGTGRVTYAHHPMVRMAGGGRLTVSPKRAVLTDPQPQYAGHGLWALDQVRQDFALATIDGGVWDVRDYPAPHPVEDFCILVEAETSVGWTALLRHAERDVIVVLKDAVTMPVTMLWISNGGRDFPPWNGRHTGVLGIEDGMAAGATGLARALGPNPVADQGVPTAAALGAEIVTRHAIVNLPAPDGWAEVADVAVEADALRLTGLAGDAVRVPFDGGFFA